MAERLYPDLTVFIQVAIFLLLLLILTRFIFKPFLKVIAERRKRIEGAREEADRLKENLNELLGDYNTQIVKAKRENARLIDDMRKEGDDLGKELISKARLESEKSFNESRDRIWKEARKLEDKLAVTADEISSDLASKILK